MPALELAYERCVRTRAKEASCRACVDACPAAAVSLDEKGAVAVDRDRCVGCGLCQGACPTEAFSGAVDVKAFLAAPGAPDTVSCGKQLPCVGALAAEELFVLAVRAKGLRLETCEQCAPAVESRLAQANALLESLGAAMRGQVVGPTSAEPPEDAADRRAFLRRLLPAERAVAAKNGISFDATRLDRALLRGTPLTTRRERLLEVISPEGPAALVSQAAIGFSSQKRLDANACTMCLRCVNACPTAALSTTRLHDELRFDGSRCVKCGLCHDVCEPRALTVAETYEPTPLRARGQVVLGKFRVQRCVECGNLFKFAGGEHLCERCRSLDDEARELAGF